MGIAACDIISACYSSLIICVMSLECGIIRKMLGAPARCRISAPFCSSADNCGSSVSCTVVVPGVAGTVCGCTQISCGYCDGNRFFVCEPLSVASS
jgi:hypothetical protein